MKSHRSPSVQKYVELHEKMMKAPPDSVEEDQLRAARDEVWIYMSNADREIAELAASQVPRRPELPPTKAQVARSSRLLSVPAAPSKIETCPSCHSPQLLDAGKWPQHFRPAVGPRDAPGICEQSGQPRRRR